MTKETKKVVFLDADKDIAFAIVRTKEKSFVQFEGSKFDFMYLLIRANEYCPDVKEAMQLALDYLKQPENN
jgi:hypothetical protein